MTWGDVFWRWVMRGYDHSFAAWKADQWEKRKGGDEDAVNAHENLQNRGLTRVMPDPLAEQCVFCVSKRKLIARQHARIEELESENYDLRYCCDDIERRKNERIEALEAAYAELLPFAVMSWLDAKRALEWFESEYIGQDARDLWLTAIRKAAASFEKTE